MQRGAVTADKANIIREKKDYVNIMVVNLKFRWNGQLTRKIEVTKLTQENIGNLNKPITIEEIESVVKKKSFFK